MFIHLCVRSDFSLLNSTIKIPQIIKKCVENKMPAVALTDENNLYGALQFAEQASASGVQPIIGCIIQIKNENKNHKITLLAKNEAGYLNLITIIKQISLNNHITLKELFENSNGLILLTGKIDTSIAINITPDTLNKLQKFFKNNWYIELQRHKKPHMYEQRLINLAYEQNIPLVATNDVCFQEKYIHEAHDALICIADGKYMQETKRRRYTEEHYFKSQQEMQELFEDIPEAIDNTVIIAKKCAFMPYTRKLILPTIENIPNPDEELKKVSKEKLQQKLEKYVYTEKTTEEEKEKINIKYFTRMEYEINIITQMKYTGYFFIVADFIEWSKKNNIPVGPGRGSSGGSIVAWALDIINFDPIRFGLIFERFLNPERISMPDIDIDFCQEKRDKVIEYVINKYGKEKVAHIITFGTMQTRGVLRDVGRVLQMSYNHVDKICQAIPNSPTQPITLQEAIALDEKLQQERDEDPLVSKLLDISLKLEGLYRHTSIHAAGVVIADKPLDKLIPICYDKETSMPITQFSMHYAEKSGLIKFDFLGLKTLTVINNAVNLIKKRHKIKLNIDDIPLDDSKTYQMLASGNNAGIFQLENRSMVSVLQNLKPDNIEDIIVLISLNRPGPMDNIPTYINRKHKLEKPDYLHPILEPTLKETFGVIVYQEQVIKIAQVMANYTLGAADILRRAMGKKKKEEMDMQKNNFIEGATKNKVPKAQATEIFDLVAKFAGYGFNKSHATAYGIISYQTAYLKANYPKEFFTALMNIDIHDTDKLNFLCYAAKSNNIKTLPPDINLSHAEFTVENNNIRYALGACKNIGVNLTQLIAAEREKNGKFTTIFNLAERLDHKILNKKTIENLAKAGALDSIHPNRKQIISSVPAIISYCTEHHKEKNTGQINIFDALPNLSSPPSPSPTQPQNLPSKLSSPPCHNNNHKITLSQTEDWPEEEKIKYEFEAIGFYLTSHPLNKYKSILQKMNVEFFRNIKKLEHENTIYLVGIVSLIKIRYSKRGKIAHIILSDPTHIFPISIYNSNMINTDIIYTGAALFIETKIKIVEGEAKLNAMDITSLENIIQNRRLNLKIIINKNLNIEKLKNIIGDADIIRGNARITLEIEINNQKPYVQLPDKYHLKASQIEKIKQLEGVVNISEL